MPLLQRRGFANRTTIQSFDWRTLVGIKQLFPEMRTVALVDETTLVRGDKGQYEWLAGIDLERGFGGDFVAAAAWVGAGVVSAVHGLPSNATVEEKGYVPFTDAGMVRRAHELGMKVLPWTVSFGLEFGDEKLTRG